MTRRIIVLRPEPGASATVAAARAMGLMVEAVPLFAVVPVPWSLADEGTHDALLLTSANALRHAGPGLDSVRTLPALCVGAATAAAAHAARLHVALTGEGGVDALLAQADGALPNVRRLLWLCGVDRRTPAPSRFALTACPVYRSAAVPRTPFADDPPTLFLLHSVRAAQRIAALTPDRAAHEIVAISQTVADAAGAGWRGCHVAAAPSDAAVLALAALLCQNTAT